MENLNVKFTNSYLHSYISLVLYKLEFDRARLSYPLSQGQNPGRPESSPLFDTPPLFSLSYLLLSLT